MALDSLVRANTLIALGYKNPMLRVVTALERRSQVPPQFSLSKNARLKTRPLYIDEIGEMRAALIVGCNAH